MSKVRNPILPGFNPDPSFIRVGSDYYIATSTFEWYPGVQIHHSTDLANWALASRPLERASQLDMRGNPDSGGVWAPCLSHDGERFWLIYTDVKRLSGSYKDTHNYVVWADDIAGPWSDAVYLNSSGFDPSLFHDDDGRKWLVNMVWDHRGSLSDPNGPPGYFAGIDLQEYDPEKRALIGPIERIFGNTSTGYTEAPHLYKRDGWYYLITAEGGTGYGHAVTHARSRDLSGPYEVHPQLHPLTARGTPDASLQRVGHGQFADTPDGRVFHTFLCSRPLTGTRRSPLGRETGITEMRWGEDGWMYAAGNSQAPAIDFELPGADAPGRDEEVRYDFDTADLPADFQWLRTPDSERIFSLAEKPGCLRLFGREAIGSWFEQALVARRQTHHVFSAETVVDLDPANFQQMAGLVAYYNRSKFHYLHVGLAAGGRMLSIQSCPARIDTDLEFPIGDGIALPDSGPVWLGADVDGASLQFRYATREGEWQPVGPVLDHSALCDETGSGDGSNFTGTFIGMAAQDSSGQATAADFGYFAYRGTEQPQ